MKNFLIGAAILLSSQNISAQILEENQEQHCNKHQHVSSANANLRINNLGGDNYDLHFYHIRLTVSPNTINLGGNVIMGARVISAPMDTFWFDLNPSMQIDSVVIDGVSRAFLRNGITVYVPLASPRAVGTDVFARIYYDGTPTSTGGFFSGVTTANSSTWGVRSTWTLSEPFNTPTWLPCKQDLYDKIDSVFFDATTFAPNKVGANGLLIGVDTLGNNLTYKWRTYYKTAFYLVAFSVSKYAEYINWAHPAGLTDSIFIQHWVYDANNSAGTSAINTFKSQLDRTPDMVELYSDLYGVVYPFHEEKYGHMQSQIGGGMEHQTMSTMGSFGSTLIAHELAHQWFGDYVTCGTWSDIWLNEGFASFAEYEYLETQDSVAARNWMNQAHTSARTSTSGSVYAPAGSNENRLFSNALTYKKGGSVLHTLRYLMGDSLYYEANKLYLTRFANFATITDSLLAVVNQVSGANYSNYFNEWVYGGGFPTYSFQWNQIGNMVFINSNHTTSSSVTTNFSNPVPIRFQLNNGGIIDLDVQPGMNAFVVTQTVANPVIDPNLYIIKGTSSNIVYNPTLAVSTQDLSKELVLDVYPNPSNGILNVNSSQVAQMAIYSLNGKLLITKQLTTGASLLDISNLPSGIYLYSAKTANGVVNGKIVRL